LNRAEVIAPWQQYAREGNSLFLFRIVMGVMSLVATLPLVIVGIGIGWRMFNHSRPSFGGVLELMGLGLIVLVLAVVFALIGKLTRDFVVPLMYLRRQGACACWRALLQLLAATRVISSCGCFSRSCSPWPSASSFSRGSSRRVALPAA